LAELGTHFRPEFLNRVDDIVLFKPLTSEEIEQIVVLQVDNLRRRMSERRIELILTPEARRLIAENGYDPAFGARPLRRYIQRHIETPIARALLAGEVLDGARVTLATGPAGLELHSESRDHPEASDTVPAAA
jgi:ATP-dependent Clp protease ATP-binding subunit ClpB